MKTKVKAIPEGYHSLTPYMIIKNASAAIEFYKKAFHATELFRMDGKDGKIKHAELQIGDSRLMLSDEFPEMEVYGPKTTGHTPVFIHLYVEKVDEVFKNAVAAGATVIRPLADQFYGDRSACLTDPFGHCWNISTHVEDVPPEEIAIRAKNQECG